MITILLLLGLSFLAIEIAYMAVLSRQVKDLLWLTDFKLKTIEILSKFSTWKQVGLTLLCPLALLFKLWHEIGLLVNCQYCTAFWLGFIFGCLTANPILTSICYGGLVIGGVRLIEKTII